MHDIAPSDTDGSVTSQTPAPIHDAFISYSRQDRAFAVLLEKTLRAYRPPKGVTAPKDHLRIFRDESDFTGTDYFPAIDVHLGQSRKLILLCSPAARASRFVDDEVRRFIQLRGAANVIPLLLRGRPNNEVKPGQEADAAFPQALCDGLQMPLATSYVGFEPNRHKVAKGPFQGAWYALLANLYDVMRSEIEDRDRKRRTRQRRVAGSVAALVIVLALAGGTASYRWKLDEEAKFAAERAQAARIAQEEWRVSRARARQAIEATIATTLQQVSLLCRDSARLQQLQSSLHLATESGLEDLAPRFRQQIDALRKNESDRTRSYSEAVAQLGKFNGELVNEVIDAQSHARLENVKVLQAIRQVALGHQGAPTEVELLLLCSQ